MSSSISGVNPGAGANTAKDGSFGNREDRRTAAQRRFAETTPQNNSSLFSNKYNTASSAARNAAKKERVNILDMALVFPAAYIIIENLVKGFSSALDQENSLGLDYY